MTAIVPVRAASSEADGSAERFGVRVGYLAARAPTTWPRDAEIPILAEFLPASPVPCSLAFA